MTKNETNKNQFESTSKNELIDLEEVPTNIAQHGLIVDYVNDDEDDYDYQIPHMNARKGLDLKELENKDIPKFSQYLIKDGHYMPIQSAVKELPAGYYKPEENRYNGEIYATPKHIVLPKLYELPNEVHDMVLNDIKHFWESEERYKKFGNIYKRNILLYSVPGNGKTCLINILAKELIEKYNGIIMVIDDELSLETYPKLMQQLRQVEPKRKIITVIEDFDRLIKKDYLSSLLLQMLDGSEVLNGVVTIATTNFPEQIGEQYTSRPSRFNLKIEYKKPTADVRRYYMTQKLIDAGIEIDDELKKRIEKYVKKTENYTFDFVKEVVEGIFINEIPEDQLFKELDDAIEKRGVYKTTENELTKVGFGVK